MSKFADDAIGFYLQLDDALTPKLGKASKAYAQFTKDLFKYNQQAFVAANKGMGALAGLADAFIDLPERASKGYTAAFKVMQGLAKKPIVQAITFKFDDKQVNAALGAAIGKMLQLSKVKPTTTGKANFMETFYKNLPKFAAGGIVDPKMAMPGLTGPDTVVARLRPGEVVTTPPTVKGMPRTLSAEEDAARTAAHLASAGIPPLSTAASKYGPGSAFELASQRRVMAGIMKEIRSGNTELESDIRAEIEAVIQSGNKADIASIAPMIRALALNKHAAPTPLYPISKEPYGPFPAPSKPVPEYLISSEPYGPFPAPKPKGPADPCTCFDKLNKWIDSGSPVMVNGSIPGGPPPGPAPTPTPPSGPMLGPFRAPTHLPVMSRIPPAEVATTIRNIKRIEAELEKLDAARKAGFKGDVITRYNAFLHSLGTEMRALDAHTGHYGYDRLKDVAGEIGTVRDKWKELNSEGVKCQGVFQKLLLKILGPAQFLAVNKALEGVQHGIQSMADAGNQIFAGVGGHLDDFITNFNQINQHLGLTRDQLAELKTQAIDEVATFKGAFNASEYSASYEALVNLGMKGTEVTKHLGDVVTMMHKGTGTAVEDVAAFAYQATQYAKLTEGQVADVAANVANISKLTSADAGQMMQHMNENIKGMSKFFLDQTSDTQAAILQNMNAMSGALVDSFGDAGNVIGQMMAKAAGGSNEAVIELQKLTGVSVESLRESLKTGKGLDMVIQGLADNVNSLGGSGEQFNQVMESIFQGSLSPDQMAKIGQNVGKVVGSMHTLQHSGIDAGKGMDYLHERTLDVNTSFTTFLNRVGNAIGSMHAFGVSGIDVLNFMKEFGLQNIHSSIYILRTFWPAVSGLAGGFWTLATNGLRYLGILAPLAAAETTTAAATLAAGGAAATAAVETATLGESIAALGLGIGTFIAEIGTGAATAVVEVMLGIAAGAEAIFAAVANPVGLIALAALDVSILAVGEALNLAAPAMKVFEKGWEALLNVDIKKMVVLGPALAMTGVGFASMGVGVLAGTAALSLAVPGLIVFGGAIALLGRLTNMPGQAAGLAGLVDSISAAFVVDQTKLDKAVMGITGAAKLIVGIAALDLAINAVGIADYVVNSITNFLIGDPLANFATNANAIVDTVSQLVKVFAPVDIKDLPAVAAKIAGMGQFMEAYAKISTSIHAVAPVRGVIGGFKAILVGTERYQAAAIPGMAMVVKKTIISLIDIFRGIDAKDLPATGEKVKAMGQFMEGYASIQQNTLKAAPMTGFVGGLIDVFTGTKAEQLTELEDLGGHIAETVNALARSFKGIEVATVTVAKTGVTSSVAFMTSFLSLIDTSKKIVDADPSAIVDAGAKLDPAVNTMTATIMPQYAMIAASAASWTKEGVDKTNGVVLAMIGGISQRVTALALLGQLYKTSIPDIDSAVRASMEIAKIVEQVEANAAAAISMHIEHKVDVPTISADQIQQAISVAVKGKIESEDSGTHDRLDKIVDLLARRSDGPVAVARPAGPQAQALAGGK